MPNRNSPSFDTKLDEILRQAAAVFCARGYDRATIRDISRATGVSLSGLYYYFSSKEQLLYLIQRHAFETILAEARAALATVRDTEERLRNFVGLHLKFFIEHPNEMKVLTHEEAALGEEWRREVHAIKKNYYRLCYELVEAVKETRKLRRWNTRLAVLALFGMMNWIYTWYNPRVDPDAPAMAREMSDMFLYGLLGPRAQRASGRENGSRRRARSAFRNGQNGSAKNTGAGRQRV